MLIDKKEVGSRIKTIRINLKETTAKFAQRFDPPASDSLVSRWERGVNLPNNERLKAIADLEGISVNELLYGVDKLVEIYDYTYLKITTPLTFKEKVEYDTDDRYSFKAVVEISKFLFGGSSRDEMEVIYKTDIEIYLYIPLNTEESYSFHFFGASMLNEPPFDKIFNYKALEALKKYILMQALNSKELIFLNVDINDIDESF